MRKQLLLLSAVAITATTAQAQMKVGQQPTTLATNAMFQVQAGSTADTGMVVLKNGNVGIGTTTPSQRLDVHAVGLPTGSTPLANIEAQNGGDGLIFGHTNSQYIGTLGALSGNGAPYLQFYAYHSPTANMARHSGAGGGYPGRLLGDDGANQNAFAFQTGDIPPAGTDITWADRMVIHNNGNVGVGISTTFANTKHLIHQTGVNNIVQRLQNPDGGFSMLQLSDNVDNTMTLGMDATANYSTIRTVELRLGTNNLDRVTILNNGNVGIGTSAPTAKLQVVGLQTLAPQTTGGTYSGITPGGFYMADGTGGVAKGVVMVVYP